MKATNLRWIAMTTLALATASTPAPAQGYVEQLGKINLATVGSLQVMTTNDIYVARMEVTFENQGAAALKLRGGAFCTSIESNGKRVQVGVAVLPEVEIPAATVRKSKLVLPGRTTNEILIALGPRSDETMDKIVKLLNVVGDTRHDVAMHLKGTTAVGFRVREGWIFRKGEDFELELSFTPQFKREVWF